MRTTATHDNPKLMAYLRIGFGLLILALAFTTNYWLGLLSSLTKSGKQHKNTTPQKFPAMHLISHKN